MKRHCILVVLLVLFQVHLIAQNFLGETKNCGNDYLISTNNYQFQYDQKLLESFTEAFIRNIKDENKNYRNPDTALFIIPVVFHVIHDGEESNLRKSDILEFLSELNKRSRRLNQDTIDTPVAFLPLSTDTRIEFRLANKTPMGNCSDGIIRIMTDTVGQYVSKLSRWPHSKYMNVYLQRRGVKCDYSPSPTSKVNCYGVNGFAYLPNNTFPVGNFLQHDIFVSYQLSPVSFTHEVGHWLNLLHLWSPASDDTPDPLCILDDGVSDTPSQDGPTPNCPNFPYFTCDSILGNMYCNYMDYSTCGNMFSHGQRDRMWAALNSNIGLRDNLWTTENLQETGVLDTNFIECEAPPVADFGFGKFANYWCTPNNIPFWDASGKSIPTSWLWSFEGGSPSTSTEQNPIVSYENSGDYNVTLIVSNGFGSDTIQRIIKIIVFQDMPFYSSTDLTEDFDDIATDENRFYFYNDIKFTGWEVTSISSNSGSSSMMYDHTKVYNNYAGSRHAFFTPKFDISNISEGKVTFYVSAAKIAIDSLVGNSLGIFASVECAEIQDLIQFPFEFSLDTLLTVEQPVVVDYIPAQNEWKKMSIEIPDEVFQYDEISLVFRYRNNVEGLNRLFIDNVSIEDNISTVTSELQNLPKWDVFPNPTGNGYFQIKSSRNGYLNLFSLEGKLLLSKFHQKESQINLSDFPNGIYLIKFETDEFTEIRKIINAK